MRIGLIGLGRIGSFHVRTPTAPDAVEGLVVAEACTLSWREHREHRAVRLDEVR